MPFWELIFCLIKTFHSFIRLCRLINRGNIFVCQFWVIWYRSVLVCTAILTYLNNMHLFFFLSFPDYFAFYFNSPLPFSSWPSEGFFLTISFFYCNAMKFSAEQSLWPNSSSKCHLSLLFITWNGSRVPGTFFPILGSRKGTLPRCLPSKSNKWDVNWTRGLIKL